MRGRTGAKSMAHRAKGLRDTPKTDSGQGGTI